MKDNATKVLDLPSNAKGVLPDRWIRRAKELGIIGSSSYPIPDTNIQPASVDLQLGPLAYRLQCSFLPDDETVETKLKHYKMGEIDLAREGGGILERNRPYLIPLVEELNLPPGLRAKANPKSSTGRLDIFTRVITDHSYRFDEVREGYEGQLYLEVVSRSFTARVASKLSLNQLRFAVGETRLNDSEIVELHQRTPLLYVDENPVALDKLAVADGLFVSLDLRGDRRSVGYRAKKNSHMLDLSALQLYDWDEFWEQVPKERAGGVVLEPEEFYLLLSRERVRIPPDYAAEMIAYDPTSGELRTHYAGFFDPGFGHNPPGGNQGSRAALEVRAHDVPFLVESGQRVCKIGFERMLEPADNPYGLGIGSSYQGQEATLSKHFRPPPHEVEQLRIIED